MTPAISTIKLGDFKHGNTSRKAVIEALGKAFSTYGFIFVRGHQIPKALTDKMQQLSKQFFHLSQQQLESYIVPESHGQVGYTAPFTETGEHFRIPDSKHFFHIREENRTALINEVPDFIPTAQELFECFKKTYKTLLEAVGCTLGQDPAEFSSLEGNSTLRLLHYMATENPLRDEGLAKEGGNAVGMCASKHTDINFMTLLYALEPGLELFYNGNWMPITIPDEKVIIVNCGDMLQHLTGGYFKSGLHRVVCQPNTERYSFPFFGHPKPETSLVPLKGYEPKDAALFPHKTAGEFLDTRLIQIGLKKT